MILPVGEIVDGTETLVLFANGGGGLRSNVEFVLARLAVLVA
jgi:hypothetical protein